MANHFCTNSVEEQVNYLIDKINGLNTNKLDKTAVVQETGTGTDVVMSQKAVTDAIANKGLDTLTNVNLTVGNTTVQYNTTNGIQINSTARFTSQGTNHDATMELDLPIVGKDGIVIDKAADSEKIEISGKNLRQALETEVGQYKVYASRNGNANDFLWTGVEVLDDLSLVIRGNNGCIYTNMPDAANTKDTTVPNKKYVDERYVKKTSSTAGTLIYTNVNGTDSSIGLSLGNEIGKVAQYYDKNQWPGDNSQGGLLVTATPTKPYHAANKKYVDDAIASSPSTTQTKYQHNLVLEGTQLGSTFKAFMSIPRSDNTAFGTLDEVIAAIGDAALPCTGYIYDGNQKSYNIVSFNPAGPGFEYNDPATGGQVFMIGNDDVTVTDVPISF